jgi:acyl carrier protein
VTVVEDKVRGIIAGILGVDPETLPLQADIRTVATWDSMAQIRIIAELESVFDCFIPIESVPALRRVSDFVGVISR